uniref:NADH-ubiquinone oxidoreductase chain 5 n=1 Tax=Pleonexes koreana TaxID=2663336 RepID=A0A5P9W7T4_9CRUS|nr:NADH dehydrogenase subunit 5 [Pleonexes koreana]
MKINLFINKVFSIMLLSVFMTFFYYSLIFLMKNNSIFLEWEINFINSLSVIMGFMFDWVSLLFLSVVSLISMFIMVYSVYYMEGEVHNTRFCFLLLSFVFSMFLLIVSPNIISIMLGWDGLGLSSYALVIFYQNEMSANSGMITVLSNRVGDASMLLSIGWVVYKGSWNFFFFTNLDYLIVFLMIFSSFTKSAQIPFSAWLPAAMAAPTPVSSLVHSSTLVTAGVFLVIRFSDFIIFKDLNFLCLIIGMMTTLMSGWVANFENDMKKVVALSTLSQLGMMFMAIGLDQKMVAFFHLVSHALFKSTLFMCTGFVIHNLHGSQDMRLSGVINYSSPILSVVFSCTNFSLCGFPFLAGFYSKDLILELFFSGFFGFFLLFVGVLSVGLTLSYSIRFLYNNCNNKSKIKSLVMSMDSNKFVLFSVLVLFMFSATGGYIFGWFISLQGSMCVLKVIEKFYVFSVLLFMLFFFVYFLSFNLKFNLNLNWFFSSMYFLANLSVQPMNFMFLKKGSFSLKYLDKGWFEVIGPQGLSVKLGEVSFSLQKSQSLFMAGYFMFSFFLFFLFLMMM